MKPYNKPPLGLMPKWKWDEIRKDNILAAMDRYTKAGKQIPEEWKQELKRLK